MEQLSAPLVSSGDVDGGGGGGGNTSGGVRNHVVKPVIPPKPEGYGTLGRSSSSHHHKSENGSAEQNRLSYSSQRPKSTEMLTEFQISTAAATAAANPPSSGSVTSNSNPATRQSPRSPRSKPPAPPVPNSPRPLAHQFSLADSQGSVLADLTLDCPCPLLSSTSQQGGGGGGGTGGGSSKHQSAYEPQLSVWNPLIEPPQLFQSAMDLDLTTAFDSSNIDDPIVPPPTLHLEHQHPPAIIKPAPPPPLSMSFQPSLYPEPMKPTKADPPRLPAVPPVSSSSASLSLNLSMDPLSRPVSISTAVSSSSSSSTTKATTDSASSSLSSSIKPPMLPIANELNRMFKPEQSSSVPLSSTAISASLSLSSSTSNTIAAAAASAGGVDRISAPPPSIHSVVQRVEPRVTTDLVKLESNISSSNPTSTSMRSSVAGPGASNSSSSNSSSSTIINSASDHHTSTNTLLANSSGPAEPAKPSRVLPLKPFPESNPTTTTKSAGQSLESIQSNPSTIDTTDSPHSLLAPNESISARNALNSELHRPGQQQPNGRTTTTVVAESSVDAAGAKSAPPPPPLLLPAPHPPPPPPPSSYMTIDIDPAAAAAASAAASSTAGSSGDSGGEKVVDFYPPNSFRPYSFHSECWRKEIPENETKWQMYKRRFSEFVFNFVACCIRCIGPV